jgi:hypothetical protein
MRTYSAGRLKALTSRSVSTNTNEENSMKKFRNYAAGRLSISARAYWLCAALAGLCLAFVFPVMGEQGARSAPFTFNLVPASAAIAACLPNANADVTVFPNEEIRGVDTLDLKAGGLKPETTFAVFLTELPAPPFGAVQYIGDFTTNSAGNGSLRVDTIVEEAFSSQVVNGQRVRKELNNVVLWFADPADDEECVPGSGPSPFDGDANAGLAALSSQNPNGAPLP